MNMKKSTYMILTFVASIAAIIGYMYLQYIYYVLPLPITKPANLKYVRVDNYQTNQVKFVSGQEDIITVAEILNTISTDGSTDNKEKETKYAVMITDGSKTYTFYLADGYVGCEGHWFKYSGDATNKIQALYPSLNYEEKTLSK